jgi:polyhydroxyalkanoate synthase
MIGLLKVAAKLAAGRPPVGSSPADEVIRENKWRLLRYRREGAPLRYATPVLLVPSLINRHYVLDLLPGRSFVEHMVKAGHDVFLLDWGTPGDEDRFVTFDTVCDRYLGRALRATCKAAGQPQAHLLGYCLGGTLTAIHAAARPEHVASLVALAAPINFHDQGLLSIWTRGKTFDVDAVVDAFGNAPWPLMQASFHMLKPTLNLVKLMQLVERSADDEFLDSFFAIETWGADNISFPGECYRRYIKELYRGNALMQGTFTLSGRPARLEDVRCPTLAVTFQHDHIVPPESCRVLLDRVGSRVTRQIHLSGGHVGAVVSRRAASGLWPQLSAWWAEHEVVQEAPRLATKPAPARPAPKARAPKRAEEGGKARPRS